MILLLAERTDPHALAIQAELARRGFGGLFILDAAKAHQELRLSIDPIATPSRWSITSREDPSASVTSENLQAVFPRRYGQRDTLAKLIHPASADIDQAEMLGAVQKLVGSLDKALFPLGHPRYAGAAENKLLQLKIARQVGLATPATLYANDPAALAEFAERYPLIAVKPLSHGVANSREEAARQSLMWCRAYPGAGLAERIRGLPLTQLYLQEAVPKVADLRIVVLPDHLFACEIDSSALAATEPDFRSVSANLPHRIISLPAALEQQLRDYLAALNLRWGSFDLALRPDGEHVFFECNPNGQWHWIERLTGAPLAAAFADTLLAGRR